MSDFPRAIVPLRYHGFLIGQVEINPDGSFSGKVQLREVQEELIALMKVDQILGIGVNFEIREKINAKHREILSRRTPIV